MTKPDPWAKLTCPREVGKLSVLRVDAESGTDLFWTRDHLNRIGVQFGFAGKSAIPSRSPKLRGINIWTQSNPATIRLTLIETKDSEIFHSLAEDLIRVASSANGGQEAIDRLYSRLERWQKLLAREQRGVLTAQEIRGLFGELCFLEQEVLPRLGGKAVDSWNGPEGSPQDFAVNMTVIEVKTLSSQDTSKVVISSPGQLWPSFPKMYLVVYPIGTASDPSHGRTLYGLVSDIKAVLKDGPFEGGFVEKLEKVGYLDLPEYEETSYVIGQMESYLVREGFPRIHPSAIPDGVEGVTFSLILDKCQQFKEPIKWDSIGS